MSLMINGELSDEWLEAETKAGAFVRKDSVFRNWITPDGAPGPTGEGGFKAEPGRYHLYVSHACPWSHRTVIFRTLKRLEKVIAMSVVHPHMTDKGWKFASYPGATEDLANGADYLYRVYKLAQDDYTGIVQVPVLWDTKHETIVNNESSEIIRMFNSAFEEFTEVQADYYPETLRARIDEINDPIYKYVNNGVYRCGFATKQNTYEHAFDCLFQTLGELETRLARQRYLVESALTEADWRLFVTLVRFDPVYYSHFKCNLRRIGDYPNLSNYLRDLYQQPSVAGTVDFDHIKRHYYTSHPGINPNGIIPKGPAMNLDAPHDRARLTS
jgi:glutathionyl-hydroquinone reductase